MPVPSSQSPHAWATTLSLDSGGGLHHPSVETITLVWCPGHCNIKGNEVADQLPKEAVTNEDTPLLRVDRNFNKTITVVARGLRSKRPEASLLPHAHSSLLNQLSCGHCTLNHFLFCIHRKTDPLCPLCGIRDTVPHLLNYCEAHQRHRAVLRRELRRLKIPFPPDQLHTTLSFPKAAESLTNFLKSTARFLAVFGM